MSLPTPPELRGFILRALQGSSHGLTTDALCDLVGAGIPNHNHNQSTGRRVLIVRQLNKLKAEHRVWPKSGRWTITSRGKGA